MKSIDKLITEEETEKAAQEFSRNFLSIGLGLDCLTGEFLQNVKEVILLKLQKLF